LTAAAQLYSRQPILEVGVYRSLGRLRNRGVETSITYKIGGLTALGGAVLLKPEVFLSVPTPIAPGVEPSGPVPLTVNLNLDYAPAFWGPWAASIQLTHLSSRHETSDDRYELPPLTTVAVGARYRWARDKRSWTLRLDTSNLTNAQGLHVSSLGIVLPEQGRRLAITLGADL